MLTTTTPLGSPIGFGHPWAGNTVFPFANADVLWPGGATASASFTRSESVNRFLFDENPDQRVLAPIVGTNATPLFGGGDALAAMHVAIETTGASPGDFILMLNWNCEIDLKLPHPSGPARSLRQLLSDPARNQVQIRALFWAGDYTVGLMPNIYLAYQRMFTWIPGFFPPTQLKHNSDAADAINNLPVVPGRDARAELDRQYLPFGSHHQKVLLVNASGKLSAFVGGVEWTEDRLLAVSKGSPLFDVSVKLEGEGARAVYASFADRWTTRFPGDTLRTPTTAPFAHPLTAQVSHTYAAGCPFPKAIRSACMSATNAIDKAREYFYMECQYYVGSPLLENAIRRAMSKKPGLVGIVVIAAEDSVADLPDVQYRRREFLRPLVSSFPGRFLVFERLGGAVSRGGGSATGPGAYVHSKLLLVDDEALLIGSMNSSRRSWFHDSEIYVSIVDSVNGRGGTSFGTRGWVRDFRCQLWEKHFRWLPSVPGETAAAIALWQATPDPVSKIVPDSVVRSYDALTAVPRFGTVFGIPTIDPTILDQAWNLFEDPA